VLSHVVRPVADDWLFHSDGNINAAVQILHD
jgi:hypothetical protein